MRPSYVLAIAIAAGVVPPAVAARSDWAGTAACGACHPAELTAWQATRHATTAARLPARPAGRCLACHATGEAPAGPALAIEVGCEACHGAGAAYAADDIMRNVDLARALGLSDVTAASGRAAICGGCHLAITRLTPAELSAAVHPVPAASR